MITGRLHPYLPELSIRDYNIYLRYMRGVKYQVYLDYGIMPYGALAHKGGVMALLADSLAGRQATCQDIRMPGSLSKVPLMCQTKGIRLAAQIEVLMNWHRLQDRRNEELPFRQQMERMSQKVTLQSAYHKAAQEEPALERIFCQQQAQAAAQQKLRGQNYAVASEPMSNVYGALFSILAPDDPVQRKNMRYIGILGKKLLPIYLRVAFGALSALIFLDTGNLVDFIATAAIVALSLITLLILPLKETSQTRPISPA